MQISRSGFLKRDSLLKSRATDPRWQQRVPVATVVGMVSEGMAEAEILNAYPDLQVEDVREALRYAAEAVRERELPVVGGS